MHLYQAYGLVFKSALECPQLQKIHSESVEDVEIIWDTVPEKLDQPEAEGSRYQVKANHFLLEVNQIAKYYVTEGNRIVIEKHPHATDDDVRLFLYSTPFGILLQQRDILTLHASAVGYNGKGILFCGVSGCGKSTITYKMIEQGASLISDDIGAITHKNGKAVVHPGFPAIQLWADAVHLFKLDKDNLKQTRTAIEKYYCPVHNKMCQEPVQIDKIYILAQYNEKEFKFEPVSGIEKFNALKNQTFRLPILKGQAKESTHFKLATPVAQQCSISRVLVPKKQFQLDKLAEKILEDTAS